MVLYVLGTIIDTHLHTIICALYVDYKCLFHILFVSFNQLVVNYSWKLVHAG